MIVYDSRDSFIMIAQHEHARISGEIARHWKDEFFYGIDRKEEVILGIYEHDRGWIQPDEAPLWNDKQQRPYSFIDYPMDLKVSWYKKGIDEVEQMNRYASLLCSIHYACFFKNDETSAGRQYMYDEKKRQQQLRKQMGLKGKQDEEIMLHLNMLRFCDNLSLFISLNEPGENKHPFFRDGIPQTFPFSGNSPIETKWADLSTVSLSIFPLEQELAVRLRLKAVKKEDIKQNGLLEAYNSTPICIREVTFI